MRKEKMRLERRRAQRLNVPLSITYKHSKKPIWRKADCRDISGIGIGLLLKEPLNVGDTIRLTLQQKHRTARIELTCRVAWCQKTKKDTFKTGLEVIRVKHPTRFIELICGELVSISVA